jgi:hypothetical protein
LTSRGPASLRSGLAAIGSRAENELGSNEVLVSLAMYHRLLEPEFTSTAPIIGPVIVKVRRIWNWMSTKWYLRPILRQQNNINAQLVLMLTELAHRQEVTEQRIIEMESMLKGLDSPTYQEECQE